MVTEEEIKERRKNLPQLLQIIQKKIAGLKQ